MSAASAKLPSMSYEIPAGTRVSVRNLVTGKKITEHVTRKPLTFKDRSGTGYGGHVFYFQYGDWEISVRADLLR